MKQTAWFVMIENSQHPAGIEWVSKMRQAAEIEHQLPQNPVDERPTIPHARNPHD
jgi:hypothetical protein